MEVRIKKAQNIFIAQRHHLPITKLLLILISLVKQNSLDQVITKKVLPADHVNLLYLLEIIEFHVTIWSFYDLIKEN